MRHHLAVVPAFPTLRSGQRHTFRHGATNSTAPRVLQTPRRGSLTSEEAAGATARRKFTAGLRDTRAIRPMNENGAWLSGRMNTEGKENFTYGVLEASIQLPNTTTQGLWAAWWTLGSDITTVPWPGCGEEDIMEDWSPQVDNGEGTTGDISTVHTTKTGGSGVGGRFTFPSGQAGNTAFHTYGIVWTVNDVKTFVDDPSTPFLSITPSSLPSGDTWPFNQSMFAILNVAVGGTLGGSDSGLASPAQPMLVDYVRWYTPSTPVT